MNIGLFLLLCCAIFLPLEYLGLCFKSEICFHLPQRFVTLSHIIDW